MENITARQAVILAAIVKEYSQTGKPIGSEELEGKYSFEVSSATIRNEMKALEQAGFISQPHTSAGRVPTDKGYRYFVNRLMKHIELTGEQQKRLAGELAKFKQQYLELGQSLTRLLAEETRGAAFALLPADKGSRRQLVSTTGLSKVIDELTSQEEVKELANFLDDVEQYGHTLAEHQVSDVETLIGSEAPGRLSEFSVVVSRVRLPSGGKGIIGIVGPKRMKYARNISLLEYVSKFLAGGLGAFILIFKF